MGQKRRWLGTKVMKTKYHHSEDPRFGQYFKIVAIQLESIEKDKFSDWIDKGDIQFEDGTIISFSDYLEKIRKMGETNGEWKKMKSNISEIVCKDLNDIIGKTIKGVTPVKDVIAYKVHYFGDPKDVYQIL